MDLLLDRPELRAVLVVGAPVVVTYANANTYDDMGHDYERLCRIAIARIGGPVVAVPIVGQDAARPSTEARRSFASALNALGVEGLHGVVQVVLADGLRGSIIRSVLAGVALASRFEMPLEIVGSLEAGAARAEALCKTKSASILHTMSALAHGG